jgi:hypothetical protein
VPVGWTGSGPYSFKQHAESSDLIVNARVHGKFFATPAKAAVCLAATTYYRRQPTPTFIIPTRTGVSSLNINKSASGAEYAYRHSFDTMRFEGFPTTSLALLPSIPLFALLAGSRGAKTHRRYTVHAQMSRTKDLHENTGHILHRRMKESSADPISASCEPHQS